MRKKKAAKKARKNATAKKIAPGTLKKLQQRASKVRTLDSLVQKSLKLCTPEAIKAGNLLLALRADLKKMKGMQFKLTVEKDCQVPYKRAYNYMRLAKAAQSDPSIKRLGLTEAYIKLRLVTRKPKEVTEQLSCEDPSQPDGTKRRIGARELVRERSYYVLEVDGDVRVLLAELIAASADLDFVLDKGGLLIRQCPIAAEGTPK